MQLASSPLASAGRIPSILIFVDSSSNDLTTLVTLSGKDPPIHCNMEYTVK